MKILMQPDPLSDTQLFKRLMQDGRKVRKDILIQYIMNSVKFKKYIEKKRIKFHNEVMEFEKLLQAGELVA